MKNKVKPEIRAEGHSLRLHFAIIIFAILLFAMVMTIVSTIILARLGLLRVILAGPISIILFTFLLSICIASALAYYVNNHILQPIVKLSNASKTVAKGNFDVRINTLTHIEELNATFDNFNNMVKELGSIETLRNDFIAGVSHEFKTPLSAIEGYATLLQDESVTNEEKHEYIRKIHDNTRLLSELTGNILLLSKLENRTFTPSGKRFRLDEQIREAILTHEMVWTEKGHELEIDLEELEYEGEESLLLHVWLNLIGNALKFTDCKGSIAVSLKRIDDNAVVTVKDSGIGMTEETKKHIFEKFYQGDSSHKGQGNGLGLALCDQIVKMAGGKIECESELNKGTTFIVTLPIE
ncbi:MAG: HAMP domain-containing histidine kinase [Ruminococcaceae bacterium]|nr:HAMP domain-containing histidine kinase [Oscillospiraceae bacterium]